MRATIASGMMVPNRFVFIQAADFAERSGLTPISILSSPHQARRRRARRRNGATAPHPCRTASARTGRRRRPWRRATSAATRPAGRSAYRRRRGRRRPCPRPCGRSAVRFGRAGAARCRSGRRESMSNTGLVSGWSPALGSSPVSTRRLRMPSAAAPIRSLCSAMRLRSRQVNLQDRLDAGPEEDRRRGERAHMRPRAGAVGQVDRVGEPAQRQRLGEQVLRVTGDRRRNLRGHDETAGPQPLFKRGLVGSVLNVHCWLAAGKGTEKRQGRTALIWFVAQARKCAVHCAIPGQAGTHPLESATR